MFVQGLAS